MLSRRLFLFACVLTLVPAAASAANGRVGQGPVEETRLYLPLVTHTEVPLSQIRGLAYSYYNWYLHAGPDEEIYTLRADGSQLKRLTDNDAEDSEPSWSPDGAFIAWVQTVPTVSQEAWIMNGDGSNARRVGDLSQARPLEWSPTEDRLLVRTYDPQAPTGETGRLYVTTPAAPAPTPVTDPIGLGMAGWSPRGDYIWFDKYAADYLHDLYVAHADGSQATLLVSGLDGSEGWSPDGAWIAYQKKVNGNLDVFISRPDGSETRTVASSAYNELQAGWVENGARLLVRRVLETGTYTSELYLYAMAGGTTTPFVVDGPPTRLAVVGISPDGKSVAYTVENADLDWEIKLAATNSATSTTISPRLSGTLIFGGWSSDGRQVAYSQHVAYTPGSGQATLYAANVDGTSPTYWVLDFAGVPRWLPRSSWLSAQSGGTGLRMYNPRTGAQFDLPPSADNTRLVIAEWRVGP